MPVPEEPVIAANQVRLSGEPRRILVPSDGSPRDAAVELIRAGEAVVGAEVTCTCGRCVRLRFEYEQPG